MDLPGGVDFYVLLHEGREELRQGQAIKVSAWLIDADLDSAHVIVANYSDLPIYGVALPLIRGLGVTRRNLGKDFLAGFPAIQKLYVKLFPLGNIK